MALVSLDSPLQAFGQSKPMPAVPPRAAFYRGDDHVSFGPTGDTCAAAKRLLFDHLVGELLQVQRHVQAERFRCFEIDDQLVFRRRLHR